MKRTYFGVLVAVLLLATSASAGVNTYNMVSWNVISGSPTNVYDQAIPASGPYDAKRCATGGCKITEDTVFPWDANGPSLTPEIEYITQGSGSGNYCYNVCYGVVKNGQDRNSLNLTACALSGTVDAHPTQYALKQTNFGIGIAPRDTAGTACTGTVCNGAALVIQVERLTGGSCSGNTTDDQDFIKFHNHYQ